MNINTDYRRQARQSLRVNWPVAFLVSFISAIPSLIDMVSSQLLKGSLTDKFYALSASITPEMAQDPNALQLLIGQLFDASFLAAKAVSLLCWLLAPILTVGMYHYLQEMLRNHDPEVGTIFHRLSILPKSIGLNLLIGIKVVLWAVPGLCLMFLGAFGFVRSMGQSSLWAAVMDAGMPAALIPAVMALYRYAMGPYCLADRPQTSILSAIRESKQMMNGRKLQLFLLQFSFLWLLILAMMLDTFLENILGPVLGSTLFMILQLVIQVYMAASCCAFYLDRRGEPVQQPELSSDQSDSSRFF